MSHRNLHFYMTREEMCRFACLPKAPDWEALRDTMDQYSGGELPTEKLDRLTDDLEAVVASLRGALGFPPRAEAKYLPVSYDGLVSGGNNWR